MIASHCNHVYILALLTIKYHFFVFKVFIGIFFKDFNYL